MIVMTELKRRKEAGRGEVAGALWADEQGCRGSSFQPREDSVL